MKLFYTAIFACILVTSVQAKQTTDIIVSRGGTDMEVKVKKADWQTVTYMIAGQSQPKALDKIKHIEFLKKPSAYIQGTKAFKNGLYAKAAEYYLKTSKLPAKPYFWAKDYGLYYAAKSYFYAADYDSAAATYTKLIDTMGSSRWIAEAQLGLIDVAIKKGDIALAKKSVKKYLSGKSAKKMPYYKALGELSSARTLMAAKEYKSASKTFRAVASRTGKAFPEIYSNAKLGMAQALILNKDYAKARDLINKFIEKSPDSVKPLALNALGTSYYQEAQGKKDAEKDDLIEKARWEFLKVFVLYPYSPEALKAKYFTALCFKSLSEKEKNAGSRAKGLEKEIIKRAPKSEWAVKIKTKK